MRKDVLTMKKLVCFLMACVLLLSTQSISYAQQTEQGAKPEIEIIILLDQSGSMKEGYLPNSSVSCATQAENWTQELCLLLARMPVSLRVMTFDEECRTIIEHNDMSSASSDSLKKNLEEIGHVNFNGSYTNHLKALQTASRKSSVEQVSEDDLVERNYVIISDGILTLDGSQMDVVGAVNEFQTLCKELSQTGNYIYLLGLGTQLGMFEELDGIERITVLQNQDTDLVELSKMLLGSIGRTVLSMENAQTVSGQFPIQVDDNYEKIIINITSFHPNGPLGPTKGDVSLWYSVSEAGNQEEKDVPKLSSSATTFLYIQQPIQGYYTVRLPEGTWNCRVRYIKKAVVNGIDFVLLADGQEVSKENGIYTVSAEANLSLNIQAYPVDGEDVISARYFAYMLSKEGETPIEYDISDSIADQPGRQWRKTLAKLEPDTQYICYVILQLIGQQECQSPPITIRTTSFATLQLSGIAGEIISNDTYTELEEVIPVNAKDVSYIWKRNEYQSGEQCEEFSVGVNGAITFQKPGTFQLELVVNGEKIAEILFQIEEPPPFSSFPIPTYYFMIFPVVVIIIVLLKRKTKHEKAS